MINEFLDVYVNVVESQVIDYVNEVSQTTQTKLECSKNAIPLIENRNAEAKFKSYIRVVDEEQTSVTFKHSYRQSSIEFGLVSISNDEELPDEFKTLINTLKREFSKIELYQHENFNISNTFQVMDNQPGTSANANRIYTITFKVLYQVPLY